VVYGDRFEFTRYLFLFEGAGSNPAGVAFCLMLFFFYFIFYGALTISDNQLVDRLSEEEIFFSLLLFGLRVCIESRKKRRNTLEIRGALGNFESVTICT
jgi:hypothetical protein